MTVTLYNHPPYDEFGDSEYPMAIIASEPATPTAVRTVLSADSDRYDGRSVWHLFRTSDGTLILGCYPRGDTYFALETEMNI